MKKLVGYIISIAGLAILVVGVGLIKLDLQILNSLKSSYILGAGIIFVIVGVALTMLDKNTKKSNEAEELPIYEVKGKNRKLVGYRRG